MLFRSAWAYCWRMIRPSLFLAPALLCLAALATPALGQQPPPLTYDVKTINFDLWCQEQAHLDPDRCDKRLPEDERQFEAFRSTIEKYELSHLQDKQKEYNVDQNILHRDPIDEPLNTQISQPDATTKNNP